MYISNNIRVIVYVLQILIFLTLISAQNTSLPSPPVSTKTSVINNATVNKTASKSPASNKNQEIVAEGGGRIEMQVEPSVNASQTHNREHVVNEPFIKNTSAILASSLSPTSSISPKISSPINSSMSSSTSTTTARNIPIHEEKQPVTNKTENSVHNKISARKGVNFNDTVESISKPKKPTLTLASDEPFAPSNFQSKSNSSGSHSIPKVPNFDMISESNQANTQKYVVPIVIVILSVPFVAILISILYKRGAEWWKYRHYRRMDFLINGMYDN